MFDAYQDGLTKLYDNNAGRYFVSAEKIVLIEGNDENFQKKNNIFDIGLSTNSPYVLPSNGPSIKPSSSPATYNFQPNEPSILSFNTPKKIKGI